MRTSMIIMLAALMFAASGCVFRQGDFTICSTKNVNLDHVKAARTGLERQTVGSDSQHWVIIFPVTSGASLEEAMDRALEAGRGDCMVDAVVYSYWWCIPFIYWQNGWRVKGTVINTAVHGKR